MKINPDSADFRNRVDSNTEPAKTEKAFGDTLASKSQPASAASSTQPLATIAQGLSKAELADPVKAQAAIDQGVREIMDREFSGMCQPDRDQVAAWLGKDPMMRDALLKRFLSLAS